MRYVWDSMRSLGYALAVAACVVLPGCKRSADAKADPRAACAAEAGAVRNWLVAVAAEGVVHADVVPVHGQDRYRDRPLPTFALASVDERPAPTPPVALVALEGRRARFADATATTTDAGLDDIMKSVNATGLSPGFGFGGQGRSHFTKPLVVFVGAEERWSDVVALVHAAARGGVTVVFFAFAAPTTVAPLRDTPSTKRILALASDPDEMPWKRDVAAAAELARANPTCPSVVRAFAREADSSSAMEAQRDEFMAKAADEIVACECRADTDAVKAVAWTRFGRQWGAPTKSYGLEIVGRDGPIHDNRPATAELRAPAGATWREVSSRVVELSRQKAVVAFGVR